MSTRGKDVSLGLLLAFSAYFGWGLLAPLGKILLADFSPMGLNAVRMSVATIILFSFVGRNAIVEGIDLLRDPKIFAIVLLGGGLSFTAFMLSVARLDATYATFGFYTAPLWTALWAKVKLDEDVGRSFFPAFLLLAAGGWFALGGDTAPPTGIDRIGMMWAILAAIIWAVYSVGLRQHARDLRMRPLMVATFTVSTVYFIVVAILTEGFPPLAGHSIGTWGWMVLYALVPTVGTLWLFNAASKKVPAATLNIFISVELASAAMWSFLLLGDRFTEMQLIGLGLSLFAVSWYLWTRRFIDKKSVSDTPFYE